MNDLNTNLAEKYQNRFLKEVIDNVGNGDVLNRCIQCGVCAGSCPLGSAWEHSPQKIIMMIYANQREAVLQSDAMWMCTSCYNCEVRCPSQLPVSRLMQGLAGYSRRLGLVPENQPTARFAQLMWNNLSQTGRINELKLAMSLYFMNGFKSGLMTAQANQSIAINLIKTDRMRPSTVWGGQCIKDRSGLQAMLKKANAIETEQLNAKSQ